MTLPQSVKALEDLVEAELRSILMAREMPLYQMMSYHLGWNTHHGSHNVPVTKQDRVHGVLCLLACLATGGNPQVALPASAAVELVHNFSQIHDDVQGGNPQRDKRDAVWWLWGPAQAINAGDGMHALARLALFRLQEGDVPAATMFRALQLLDEASLQACEGKFLDLEAQERIDTGVAAYLKMTSNKTGALVSCAMKLGALVTTADESILEALGTCGTKLGTAMQMRADMKEFWGDGMENPKPSPEIMNKKKLFPTVCALEMASIRVKRMLGDIYFKRVLEPEDVVRLRQLIEDVGAKEECNKLLDRYRTEVSAALATPGIAQTGKAQIEETISSLLE